MKNSSLVIFTLNILIVILNIIPAHANDNSTIKKILFEGLEHIPIDLIKSNMSFHIGDQITDNDISHAIKILFSTGHFENIQIIKNQNIVIVRVKEYPLISRITFYGNQTIKKDILLENLKLHNIQEGKFLNKKYIFKIEEILKNFYCDIGKYKIIIKTIVTTLPNNQVNLKIIFNEGPSANIQKINIIGNKNFSTATLLKLFKLHNKVPGLNIFFKTKYQKKLFLDDLKSLNSFYLNKGFAKFKIDSTQIHLTPNKQDIYLTIYITEGIQYKISDISITENIPNFSSKIYQSLKIHQNELYNYQKIQNFIYCTKKILKNYGYIHPRILTDFKINNINKTLKLYINIDIGNRFYVNKIKFMGNNFTNDLVLRREIRQMEKTWVNNNLIYQGQERLKRIGYFENIKIKKEYVPQTLDQLNIIYEIKERNSGNMNLNIGIGSESGINFQCGIQQDNLFGTGNSITINANKNHYQTYIEFSAAQPYITLDNIHLEEKIFLTQLNTGNNNLSNYSLKSYGTNLNIGFPISEYNSLNFGLDYMHNTLHNIKPQITILRYLNRQGMHPKVIIDDNPNINKIIFNNIYFHSNDLFLTLNWKNNNLNHAYFPTKGSYTNFSGKITIPGSDNKYFKIVVNNTYYLPLYKNFNYWILMGHIYTGYSGGLYGKESPFYDNFYSNDINIIRGFRANTIGPKAAYYKYDSKNKTYHTCLIEDSKDAIGGNAITILKGELIIPIPFLTKKYINTIRTSIFIDGGTIWDTYWKNTSFTRLSGIPDYKNPTNIRISNGIAIQWISPIGPVIFSYAKLIKKYTNDKVEQFQFNIGKTW